MTYFSTKTYTHNAGLSCAFRQWRANSHCKFLHGYALQVEITFGAHELDENGWVMDFGGLKYVKELLETYFDHKTCIALDDPFLGVFKQLNEQELIQLRIFENGVGCEAFARFIYKEADFHIQDATERRVFVQAVSVREHEGNRAIFIRDTVRGEVEEPYNVRGLHRQER